MKTNLSLSKAPFGVIGIVGHAGCGHANSHLGFIQDDSGGLSAVLGLLRDATGLSLEIVECSAHTGIDGAYFYVKTISGGEAKASARRGITAAEARLASYCVGKQAVCSQAIAVDCFGRILGQGAMEVPVALQTAIANAAMDSFVKAYPDRFVLKDEELEGNCGKVLGTVLDINGVPVSAMALSNATEGGIGPNEDIEGNVNLFGKKDLSEKLHLDRIPSFVIEGKVCAEPLSSVIQEPTFLIRAFPGDDNTVAARALLKAAQDLNLPAEYRPELLARSKTAMEDLTRRQGKKVIEFGERLSKASTARDKVRIAAELNEFCSQELGGITFMSNDVHKIMGGVGCIPGTSAVMSLFISKEQLRKQVLPTLEPEDVNNYDRIICGAVGYLNENLEKANEELTAAQEDQTLKIYQRRKRMTDKKKVIVFTTGGTIAMKFDPKVNGLVPAVSGADLAAAVPGLDKLADVEVREFSNHASCAMTPQKMFQLSQMIEEALKEEGVAGAVVTHGTDTVEETAYMLDILHKSEKPIVLTAAMRGAGDTSPDGPANIYCAVKTAASEEAKGKGVMVLLNEIIHAAGQVRKTHSANPDTFASPWWGPIGYCDVDRVVFRRAPLDRHTYSPKELTARVDIVTGQTGIGRDYIDFAVAQGCKGIVLEGFGRGNLPAIVEPAIKDATDKGVVVVITTRTPGGRPYQVYAYPGSVTDSRNNGAIHGGEFSSAKTRLKLMVLLSERPELAKKENREELERLLDV